MTTITEMYHELLLRRQSYRLGDHAHRACGDVETECDECRGNGYVDCERMDRPWATQRTTCENCHGRGWYWMEAR